MHPERWRRIKELVDISLSLSPSERPEYLTRVCEGDTELREEIESLIQAYDEAGELFEAAPALSAPKDPMVGARLGPYRIEEHIGAGGMGSVYRAVRADAAFHKEVAIKIVRRGLDFDHVIRRFQQERQIMASLEHPNIATVMDGGSTSEGLPYVVMEYIRGKPIDEYCSENHLGLRQRLELFVTVCEAVHFAHEKGVVHRDIKPANILITAGGIAKLLDFGIAKILNPDTTERAAITTVLPVMTPEYASPEQLRRERVTAASDVYSLGVLLCELIAGRRPHRQETGFRHNPDAAAEPPSRLAGRRELAGDLDTIVLTAIRLESEHRYPSAQALADDIRRHLAGRPIVARKQNAGYRAVKFLIRHKATAGAFAAALALVSAVSLVSELRRRWSDSPGQGVVRPLTTLPGREFQPSFSPDGKRIVYVWSGENGGNADVYVQSLEGGQTLRLTTNEADDLSPVWAKDGTRIAWLRTSRKETAIFVSPAGGGVHGKIADLYPARVEAVGRHLDWSPDGDFLAAADKNSPAQPFRIVRIRFKDGQKRDVTEPPEKIVGDMSPAFSPDGKALAFIRAVSSGVNDIYVLPAEGGAARRLTFDNRFILSLAWTPDSRSIVFSSNRVGGYALWSIAASGGTPSRIPLIGENAFDPAFSRDGRKLVYAHGFDDGNIWRADLLNPGSARKIISSTQYDSSPQYSPDGTRVAFRSSRSGAHEIWVSDSEGRHPFQLTRTGGVLTGTPRWSPDSRQIAFDSRPEGQADIYTIDAGGGALRRITADSSEDVVPSWSGDGRWIYFASNRSGVWQVWRIPSAGGSAEQVTRDGGFAAFESPDGNYLYYAKGRAVAGLWRKRLPDGEETPVLERLKPGYWGYWAIVENGIYFADQSHPAASPEICFYAFAGGRVRPVAKIEKPLALADSAFAVAPDRRYILYTQIDESGSDLMLLDHYRPPA